MRTWLVGLEVVVMVDWDNLSCEAHHTSNIYFGMVAIDFLLKWQLTLNLNLGIPLESGQKRMIHL
jgi:hypothetical protein